MRGAVRTQKHLRGKYLRITHEISSAKTLARKFP
jgi:hypothetical protein